jgi:small subunit ribosomal protein S16
VAVKLRLTRMGKTKQPTYRVVAADSRSPRNGRFIELLGTYEPRKEPSGINLNAEKIQRWLDNGAQPTERVQKILEISGILTGDAAKKTLAAKKAAKRPAKVKAAPAEEASES